MARRPVQRASFEQRVRRMFRTDRIVRIQSSLVECPPKMGGEPPAGLDQPAERPFRLQRQSR